MLKDTSAQSGVCKNKMFTVRTYINDPSVTGQPFYPDMRPLNVAQFQTEKVYYHLCGEKSENLSLKSVKFQSSISHLSRRHSTTEEYFKSGDYLLVVFAYLWSFCLMLLLSS